MYRFLKGMGKGNIFMLITIVSAVVILVSGGVYKVSAVPVKAYENIRLFTDALATVQENYVEEVDYKKLIYGAIKGMLQNLDPHSSFLTPEDYKEMQVETKGSFGGLGIEIGVRDNILTVISPIEDTPAFKAGIKAGDKIVKINDKSTKDLSITEAVKLMRGPKGTKVTIHILREGFKEPKPFEIVRDIIEVKSVKIKTLEDNIGYIRITQFQERTGSDLEDALNKVGSKKDGFKGLILDMRNNPGGLLTQAVEVSDKFLKSGMIVYTKGRVAGQEMKFEAKEAGTQPNYPMIILVNSGSASASEIVAGALQDHKRAVILGVPTFGKGSVQTIIPLNDNSALRLTTSRYYTPSGRSIQAKGIEPDIVVEDAKDGSSKDHLREKDIERHLEGDSAAPEKEQDKGKVKVEERVEKEKGEAEDIQLKRAVDYLKSWHIFQDVMKKAS